MTAKPPPPARKALQAVSVVRTIQAGSRYYFETAEFAKLVGRPVGSPGVAKALHRLCTSGVIVRATKRPSGWLIVPPEQSHYGAPPVTWWLNDCLRELEPAYYVALLSAARHWGSLHCALQTTQVMVTRPRPALTPGKLKVDFFSKRSLAQTPTVTVSAGVAPWRVSTREATLFDLVRHQSRVGGLESIARIVRDLGPALRADAVTKAAQATDQVPPAQRLGFLLDHLGFKQAANRLLEWLSSRRVPVQGLEALEFTASDEAETTLLNARWNIRYAPSHLNLLEELK